MYHANDVINGFVVYRQAGIAAVGKSFGHFVHGGIIRHGDHIHARGQNVLGFHIVKFNGAADQLAFAVGQLTVFSASLTMVTNSPSVMVSFSSV